jgi:hypothetical protein
MTKEKPSHKVNRVGKPFRLRSIGLVLATRGISNRRSQISHLPFEICDLLSRRPARSLQGSPLVALAGRKPGRYENRRTQTQPCQSVERFGLIPMTGRVIIQHTPPCWLEVVKEIAGGFVRLGEKARLSRCTASIIRSSK